MKDCDLALMVAVLNSDGTGLTEFVTSSMFLDIWNADEIETVFMKLLSSDELLQQHMATFMGGVCTRMWFSWLDPS